MMMTMTTTMIMMMMIDDYDDDDDDDDIQFTNMAADRKTKLVDHRLDAPSTGMIMRCGV
jgi:hypothetical protein